MRAQITGIFLVFASASILAADATPATTSPAAATTSATTTSAANTASETTPAATATAKEAEAGPTEKARSAYYGYRLVRKEGVEDKYCRKQKVTGSRTKVIESCLSLEEITALRENSQEMVDRMRNVPGSSSGADGFGGVTNSAVSNMNTP